MSLTLSKLHINVQMSLTLSKLHINVQMSSTLGKSHINVQMSSTLGIIQFKKFRCPWHLIYSYSSQFLSAFYSLTQVLIVVCLLFQLFIWNYKTAFIGINIRIWSMSFLPQSSNQLTTAVDYELPYKKLIDLM
jgi:hypothetical protein